MIHIVITDIKYLKTKSDDIILEDFISIIKNLEDSLDLKRGIGLSAIQIGVPKKVSIIRIKNGLTLNLINTKILEKKGKVKVSGEGCLSLPYLYLDTVRYYEITIENQGQKIVLYGLEAIACQHEIDHWNGILILDRKYRKRR